jgi:hypothetical protein
MKHKTIGRETPFLTYAIFTRIAAKEAKALKRKLLRNRIEARIKAILRIETK